jgi:hypothetical protein
MIGWGQEYTSTILKMQRTTTKGMGGGWVWVSGWEGGGGGTKAETEKEVLKRFLLHFLPWEKFLEVRAINFHAIKPVEPPFL